MADMENQMWDMMNMMMGMMGGKGGKMTQGGKAAARVAKGEKVYHGTLVSFSAEKNSGFISCKEIQNEHGMEVYAFKNVLEQCEAGVGDDIAFFLHWSAKEQAQASLPSLRLSSAVENNLVLKGTFKKSTEKPFGFIQCWETQDFFGRDVYVPANLCEGIAPGTTVAFNCYCNKDGMPNASVICACDDKYKPQAGDLSVSGQVEGYIKGMGKAMNPMMQMMKGMGMPMPMITEMFGKAMAKTGKGKGKGKTPYDGGKGKGGGGGGKKPVGTGQFMTGTVKSYNAMNNYGFIECDEAKATYGCDVFCGGDLASHPLGSTVLFQLGLNEAGKPQAMDVTQC